MPPPKLPPTSHPTTTTSKSRNKTNTSTTRNPGSNHTTNSSSASINWQHLPTSLLNRYRHFNALETPPAFNSEHNAAVLSTSSIGHMSPTMIKSRPNSGFGMNGIKNSGVTKPSKEKKVKVTKEQLALAVRKHFNGQAVNEMDVLVDLGYKLQCGERGWRGPPVKK